MFFCSSQHGRCSQVSSDKSVTHFSKHVSPSSTNHRASSETFGPIRRKVLAESNGKSKGSRQNSIGRRYIVFVFEWWTLVVAWPWFDINTILMVKLRLLTFGKNHNHTLDFDEYVIFILGLYLFICYYSFISRFIRFICTSSGLFWKFRMNKVQHTFLLNESWLFMCLIQSRALM